MMHMPLAVLCALMLAPAVRALDSEEIEAIQAANQNLAEEIRDLKARIEALPPIVDFDPVARAEDRTENRYGPNAEVRTREGRLRIGGLVQVWFYSIQNDNLRVFDPRPFEGDFPATQPLGQAFFGSNEVNDNDGFALRRAQLRFSIDIHENVSAHVTIDPAREATSLPSFPTNQSDLFFGDGSVAFNPGLVEFLPPVPATVGNLRNPSVQTGSGTANRILQDAFVRYHGVLPHHDVRVGQMRRRLGEEGSRDDEALDFAERAMITQLADQRDLGIQVHGTWWDDRLEYWLGAYDGAGTAFQQRSNRGDDNDEFDLAATVLLRPLWLDETWGSIEVGYSYLYGWGGESGGRLGGTDGLDRNKTRRQHQYAWGLYKPGGPLRGWWIRGEWGAYRDRFAPLDINGSQQFPAPIELQGWYVSTGYRLSDSRWGDSLRNGGTISKHVLEPMEFTFRYDVMDNLLNPDIINPFRGTDVFKTQAYTAGINYYIKGNKAKLQLNYHWVDEDTDGGRDIRQMREVRNDSVVLSLQVAW